MGSLLIRSALCALLLAASGWLASSSAAASSVNERLQITNSHTQVSGKKRQVDGAAARVRAALPPRRGLAGPGSWPPRCAAKCGNCTPCAPVHVPVPPGARAVTAEYYPEAWRCKCGNRLYMP